MCVCSAGCRLLQDLEIKHVEVDACGDAQSAAEGAMLGLFQYDQLKSKKKTKVTTQLHGRYTQRCHQTRVCETCKLSTPVIIFCVCSQHGHGWLGQGSALRRRSKLGTVSHGGSSQSHHSNSVRQHHWGETGPLCKICCSRKEVCTFWFNISQQLFASLTLQHCIVNLCILKMLNTEQQLNCFGVFTFWLQFFWQVIHFSFEAFIIVSKCVMFLAVEHSDKRLSLII